jgi:hypothetical protein
MLPFWNVGVGVDSPRLHVTLFFLNPESHTPIDAFRIRLKVPGISIMTIIDETRGMMGLDLSVPAFVLRSKGNR